MSKNHKTQKWFKIININEYHNDHQFKDGLNILNKPFEKEGSCVPGGFYFSDKENIYKFARFGCFIREITIPDDAKMVQDPCTKSKKWRANKIFLGKKYLLYDKETISTFGINTSPAFFTSGLLYSIISGDMECAKFCIKEGGKDFNGYALYYACKNGDLEFANMCLKNGVEVIYLNNALRCSCIYGQLECAKWCLENGANNFYNYGHALFSACENGNLECAKLFGNTATNYNHALRIACDNGHLECAKWCIEAGANNFNTGLYFACKNGHLEFAKYCVEKGAWDFNNSSELACRNGHLECEKFCIEAGANDCGKPDNGTE